MSRVKAKRSQSNSRLTGGGLAGLVKKFLTSLKKTFTETNLMLLLMVIGLTIFGIIMVFSAGFYSAVNFDEPDPFYYLKKQSIFALIGFVGLVIAANFDYHKYVRYQNLIIGASILLLIIVISPLGVTVNGAQRWINLGFTLITPSEISKICVILWTASFFAQNPRGARKWTKDGLLMVLAVMAIHALLIIKQPNLSTAIVVCAIMVSLAIVAGMDMRYLFGVAGVGVAGLLFVLTVGKSNEKIYYIYQRITSFTDPFADAQGAGYQVSQGIIALGNGGIKGLGWGNSVAKNLYLPEPQNDFILAIIGEELGFIGFIILMMVFMYLLYQCFMVALRARDRLGFYIATGISVMLALHVILNVAIVTSSMPPTGITLPFISYGGTSLIVFLGCMGILLNVSKGQGPSPLIRIKSSPEKIAKKRRSKRVKREAQ